MYLLCNVLLNHRHHFHCYLCISPIHYPHYSGISFHICFMLTCLCLHTSRSCVVYKCLCNRSCQRCPSRSSDVWRGRWRNIRKCVVGVADIKILAVVIVYGPASVPPQRAGSNCQGASVAGDSQDMIIIGEVVGGVICKKVVHGLKLNIESPFLEKQIRLIH